MRRAVEAGSGLAIVMNKVSGRPPARKQASLTPHGPT
jgi:hypothetical protein